LNKKSFFFLFFFIFALLLLPGTGHDKTKFPQGTETLSISGFSLDFFKTNFHLNLAEYEEEGNPLFVVNDWGPGDVREKNPFDPFCSSLLKKDCKKGSDTQPKKVKSKRFGRALLFTMGITLIDSIRYWATYSKWIEDWQFRLTWEDQKNRFFSLKANKFDSNPFRTNWTHGLSGAVYYNFARYYRLNVLESVLFELGFSLWWEYITEWREVISVNDNFFSGIGGLPIGEPLFQVGNYFNNKRGAFYKIVGSLFNPVIMINDLLGGRKWRKKFTEPNFSKPDFDLYFSYKQVFFKGDKHEDISLFHIGVETNFYTIPGYGVPGKNNRFIKNVLFSEICLNLTFIEASLEEFSFFTKAVLFGHFYQDITQDSSKNLKGYSFFWGAGSAFDLFKKKAIAYYDKGEYHYDFTGGEKAPQPTEFTDKFAIINLIGPVFDLSVYSGWFKFNLSLDAYIDFALVNAMALNEYSEEYDLFEPKMKTTLSHYGYYYAFGFTLASKGSMRYRNFEIKGKFKYQAYDSIEGLDRFQGDVKDDCNVTDYRLMYKVSLGYSFSNSPVKIVFACEGIDRKGTLKDITHRESETRLYTQLNLSF
jgi:hypothetical protein